MRYAIALLLAVLAAAAAVLALDISRWRGELRRGDASYAVHPHRARWQASTTLGTLAARLLGIDDDLELRRGLVDYRRSSAPARLDNVAEVTALRARAQDALFRATHGHEASQALTVLGVLSLRAASLDSSDATDAAVSELTDALRADPRNSDAAFDLELLLRLTRAHGTRTGSGTGGIGPTGHKGGAATEPGHGY